MSASWRSARFDDCIRRVTYTAKVPRKDFLGEGTWPVVSQENGLINGFWDNEADLFKLTTPVVVFGDHTRVLKYVDFDFVLGADGVKILEPREFLVPKFFFYQLEAADLKSIGYARHYRLLKDLEIRYPSQTEQHRIVRLLDDAVAAIARASSNTSRNQRNTGELFESHLDFVFRQGAQDWGATTINQLSVNLDSKRVPITKAERSGGVYPYYGASGIVDHVSEYIFEGDALLVSEDGANLLARSSPIAFGATGRYWVNNHAHVLRFASLTTQRFVEFYLGSMKLDKYVTGAAQPKLTQTALNSIPIPMPQSIEEQARIVQSIESISRETRRLEANFKRKREALVELRRSILAQAFAGAL